MGKNKQAQRVKNNAMPSNSIKKAKFLDTSIDFSTVRNGRYVVALPLCNMNEVEMNRLDSNVRIILKKMTKKNPITKYKALHEFAILCRDSEISIVEGMLPFWPRLYSALAIDIKDTVREAAQLAHAALVKRIGKNITKYLKQLAGAWFISQYDVYAPAATIATNSFNDTFLRKRIDAIIYCQHEILNYICDNLIVHNALTLSQKYDVFLRKKTKTVDYDSYHVNKICWDNILLPYSLTAKDMEAKRHNVLISSLYGYSVYLNSVHIQEIEKMIELHNKITSSNKFWNLINSDAVSVKTAFFSLLTSMIDTNVILQNKKKRTVTSIVNSLDEMDPALSSAVWKCMHTAINKIKDWYSVINIEKLLLPKLYWVLQNGGQYCPSIYLYLLPFISQLLKLNVDAHHFYTNFFTNMRQGFFVQSVQTDHYEALAVTTSFVECFGHCIHLNVNNQELINALLREQLMPLLQICLKEDGPLAQIFSTEITYLIRCWSKHRYDKDCKSYICLMEEFWRNLDVLFSSPINTNTQTAFIITLKMACGYGCKNLEMKFCNSEENIINQSQPQNVEKDTNVKFLDELENFINSICVKCFNQITEEGYITYLNKLIAYFEGDDAFENLFKLLNTKINFFNFYNKVLRSWLLEQRQYTENAMELMFNLMKYMNRSERNEILESLTEFDILIIKDVLRYALSKKHRNDDIVKKWYSQPKIIATLTVTARNITLYYSKTLVNNDYFDLRKNQDLMLLFFNVLKEGDPSTNEEVVNEIISVFCNSFYKIDEKYFLNFMNLIYCLVPIAWSNNKTIVGAVRILGILFELRLRNYFGCNHLFTNVIRSIWTKSLLEAVRKLSRTEFINVTKMCATFMWNNYDLYEENSHKKEILVNTAIDFIETILNDNVSYAEEIISAFLKNSDITTWISKTTRLIIYGEVITGKLHLSSFDQNKKIDQKCVSTDLTSETIIDNVKNCLKWALLNIDILNNLCLRSVNGIERLLIHNVNLPGITNSLINVIYSIILGEIYTKYYKSTKYYDDVNKTLAILQKSFRQLHVNEDTFHEIRDYLTLNYSKYGSILPYIIHFCCTKLCSVKEPKELFRNYKNNNILTVNEETRLQNLQILCKFQNWDNILNIWIPSNNVSELIVVRSMLMEQENIFKYSDILEKHLSLLDCDVSQISWDMLNLSLERIRLATEIVKRIPYKLTYENWNFILTSLVLWPDSIRKSKQNVTDFKAFTLMVAMCQLYRAVQDLINKHDQEKITIISPKILNEWKNIFIGDVQSEITEFWMLCADVYSEKATTLEVVILLDHLGKAMRMVDGNIIFKNHVFLSRAVELALKLLQSPVSSVQLGAYHILKHAIPKLVEQDKNTIELKNFDMNTLNIKKLEEILQSTQSIMNAILMEFKLHDTVTFPPYSDTYIYTIGYLLSWAIILDMCANAHEELLHTYAEILKDNVFTNLLNNIFRLMPMEFLQDNINKGVKLTELFSTEPSLNFGESWTEWRLDHIVCWIYTNSLRYLPMLVRQWWSIADSKVSVTINKITAHYVSPMLCQEQLLQNKLHDIENIEVKVHPSFREVTALYQIDDTKLKLNITLSPSHPLEPAIVECEQYANGANWKRRNFHMQLSVFPTHQNKSIYDDFVFWRRSLDKKLVGMEECCICFSIFHRNTCQIPKMSCHTCRKKYHPVCLYKWFNTNKKPSCPMCRDTMC